MPVKQLRERFIEIWRKRTDAEAVSDEQVLMLEQPERILRISAAKNPNLARLSSRFRRFFFFQSGS
jgi:hypothetical protein